MKKSTCTEDVGHDIMSPNLTEGADMSTVSNLVPPTESKAEAKPAAKAKKEPSLRRSKFKELFPLDAKIAVLAEGNPKKKGSAAAKRFEGYTGAETVGDALKNGVKYADIAYDVGRSHIKVG